MPSIGNIFSILWLHDVPLIWGAGVVGGHQVKALINCGTGGSCLGTWDGLQPNEAHVGGNLCPHPMCSFEALTWDTLSL